MSSNRRPSSRGKVGSGKRRQTPAKKAGGRRYDANFKALRPEDQDEVLGFFEWVRSLFRRD